jgi:predicted P-loop ATPase
MNVEPQVAADGGSVEQTAEMADDSDSPDVLELLALATGSTRNSAGVRRRVRSASADEPLERLADKWLVFINQLTPASDVTEALLGLAIDAADLNSLARTQLERIAKDRLQAAGIRGQAAAVKIAFASAIKRRRPRALGGWESELTTLPNGRYAASTANLLAMFRRHEDWDATLGYNERTGQIMWIGAPPWRAAERGVWTPTELRDSDQSRIAEWFETSRFAITVSPASEALHGAITVAAEERRFDPVTQYLDSRRWDGVPRLDSLLAAYFGAETDKDDDMQREYLAAAGTCSLIAAVARACAPGCKVDHVLTLVGAQGIGKSTAIKILAGAEYFADSLPDLNHKDAADYIRGPWIVELSELDSLSRSELTSIKAFLTRTDDRFRAAYGRRTASHPRRCVFWGTTNEDSFLSDATGNRRFWPVTVGKIDLAALRRDRDQLWAEAVVRYRNGEPWHLDTERLVKAAANAQADRQVIDVWQPLMEAFLVGRGKVTPAEMLQSCLLLKIELCGRAERNRVVAVLRQLGWTRKQECDAKGRRQWFYFPPPSPDERA